MFEGFYFNLYFYFNMTYVQMLIANDMNIFF